MKIKFGFLPFVILIALAGYFIQHQTEKQPENVQEKNSTIKDELLTLVDVTTSLKAADIELNPKEAPNDWILNKVKPNRFSIANPLEKAVYAESISIYVYDLEKARKEGLDDFNIQKEKFDMLNPKIYEHKNILILYWHHENENKVHDTKFGKEIEAAIQKL